MLKTPIDFKANKRGDKTSAMFVRFRDATPSTTIAHKRGTLYYYVVVDAQYVPISMTMVNPANPYQEQEADGPPMANDLNKLKQQIEQASWALFSVAAGIVHENLKASGMQNLFDVDDCARLLNRYADLALT